MAIGNIYSVYKQHLRCHDSFSQLFNAILDHGSGSKPELAEEYDKYKVWASNTGASNGGANWELSLDFRLQEASFLKSQVIRLLESVCRTVDKATSLIAGSRQPFEELIPPDKTPSFTETDSGEDTSSDSSWDVSDDSISVEAGCEIPTIMPSQKEKSLTAFVATAQAQTEMTQLIESLRYTIVCLYKLPVRRPAPIDRIKSYANRNLSLYQHFDVLYLRDKFPNADKSLVTRLGKLISQRRHLLEYRVSHNARLRKQQQGQVRRRTTLNLNSREVLDLAHSTTSDQSTSKEKAAAIHETESSTGDRHTKQTKATVLQLEQPIETMEALYPPSVTESVFSAASEYTDKQKLYIPPRPIGENGNPLESFECPYCGLVKHITIEKKRGWEKHVLQDLQPYVCTFQGCEMSEHLFTSRSQWYNHESQVHRAMWSCNSCQSATGGRLTFPTQSDFLDHMEEAHDFKQETLLQTVEAFRYPVSVATGMCCLCGRHAVHLKSHLGRHLEHMALFALPRPPPSATSGSRNVHIQSGDKEAAQNMSQHSKGSSSGSEVEPSDFRYTAAEGAEKEAIRFKRLADALVGGVLGPGPGGGGEFRDLQSILEKASRHTTMALSDAEIDLSSCYDILMGINGIISGHGLAEEDIGDLKIFVDNYMEKLHQAGATSASVSFTPRLTMEEVAIDTDQENIVLDEEIDPLSDNGQDISWDRIKPEFAEARQALDASRRAEDEAARASSSSAPLRRSRKSVDLFDEAEVWSLSRVTSLLRKEGFSMDWRDTFADLGICGNSFVELGGPDGAKTLESRIYPRLEVFCVRNGTGWDERAERQAGLQLLQLISAELNPDLGVLPNTPMPDAQYLGDSAGEQEATKGHKKMEHHKIIILGDANAGKTAITIQFCLNHYVEQYDPTIEDSYRKQVTIDGRKCMIEVLDTAGQEEYTALRDQWIRDGDGFVIAYSVTSRSSFDRVRKFWNQINAVKPVGNGFSPLQIMLAGNNSERVAEREVSTREGRAMALELGTMFLECSARNSINIDKVFYNVVRQLRVRGPRNLKPSSGAELPPLGHEEGGPSSARVSLPVSTEDTDPSPSIEGTSRLDKLADNVRGRMRKLLGRKT